MGVGVEIALGAQVGAALLQGVKPPPDQRVLLAQPKPLVVGKARGHALQERHKHHIGAGELGPQEKRAGGGRQGLLHGGSHPLKLRLGLGLLRRRSPRTAKPVAPRPKHPALQLAQGQHRSVLKRRAQGAKGPFQGFQDAVAFGDQPAVELQGRQQARRHQLLVPRLLGAVANHRHLANPVRNPLLLEPQPDLLAVGAPGMVIAVERHPHGIGGLTKQAQVGLGVGGTFDPRFGRQAQGDR